MRAQLISSTPFRTICQKRFRLLSYVVLDHEPQVKTVQNINVIGEYCSFVCGSAVSRHRERLRPGAQ